MILIYTEKRTPRVEYIFNQILCNILGFKITFTQDLQEAQQASLPVINYSNALMANAIQVKPAGLLTQKGIDGNLKPEVLVGKKRKIMFCTNRETLEFDLFSAGFYLITRYEEYVNREVDKHGRFIAQNSIAFKNQFLVEPLVDQWANDFKEQVLAKFPGTPCNQPEFRFIPVIDIDNTFAFKHKGFIQNTYGLLHDLFKGEYKLVKIRLKTLFRLQEDPFYRFNFMTELHDYYKLTPLYFVLRGGYGTYDRLTIYPSWSEHQKLRKLARTDIVGFLVSYKSAFNLHLIKKEIRKLERIAKKKILLSRFHCARFHLPESYRMLVKLGVQKDFSMGYASVVGFRASTSFPFYFYDLERETVTSLQVHSYVIMDRTLKDVLKLQRREVVGIARTLADRVAKVNGVYMTVFHNEAFSKLPEWEKWRDVYRAILKRGAAIVQKEEY
ncbi:MAG: polysaccharide deacetylase family protein [Prevotellaceae bacterium]|jgi:hypothetical protein|nr:polysaccharide deacetylase family protein [Prevotellaceae bacterium]